MKNLIDIWTKLIRKNMEGLSASIEQRLDAIEAGGGGGTNLRDDRGNIGTGDGAHTISVDGWNNIFFGDGALALQTDGNGNVALGYNSLAALTIGADNVFIGSYSGQNIVTGNDNVGVGFGSGPATGALVNTIALGNSAVTTESNTAQIGNSEVYKMRIGPIWFGAPFREVVAGGAAGDIPINLIKVGDRIDSILQYVYTAGNITDVVDLTPEFSVSAFQTINNTGGTDTTGNKLLVLWTKLTAP